MDNERLLKLAGMQTDIITQLNENINELEQLEEFVDTENVSLSDLERMMNAARKGLGIANKLRDPIYKRQQLSRIMSNLNRIRGALNRMIRQLDTDTQQDSAY